MRTEPDYINELRRLFRNPAVQVKVHADGRDPTSMIDAIPGRLAHAGEDFDQVWCVFDVDEFDIQAAVESASQRRVSVAISNPCFEVWLLMHTRDVSSVFADATSVRRALEAAVPGYDKTSLDFAAFAHGILDAIDRGRRLHRDPATPGPNPSSGMWRLTEIITGSGRI